MLESILASPDYAGAGPDGGAGAAAAAPGRVCLHRPGRTDAGNEGHGAGNLIKKRKRTQHIPIIFLTAYFQDDKDVFQGYGIGAVDYLTKPIDPQILKSKIGVFVDLFRKTHALAAANSALEQEISQRQKAEEALGRQTTSLRRGSRERTSDLLRANEVCGSTKALRASEAQAMAASRAKDDFLAALSHELRTPLNPVLLLATEASANPQLPLEVRADFETIAKNVSLEARLIDDMLDLTRIARGKLALEMQPSYICAPSFGRPSQWCATK